MNARVREVASVLIGFSSTMLVLDHGVSCIAIISNHGVLKVLIADRA